MEIHMMRADGSDNRRITNDLIEDAFPTWSPDGRFLLWSRMGDLVVARADGTGMRRLGTGNFPDWVAMDDALEPCLGPAQSD